MMGRPCVSWIYISDIRMFGNDGGGGDDDDDV
jgi:hypothetical protein